MPDEIKDGAVSEDGNSSTVTAPSVRKPSDISRDNIRRLDSTNDGQDYDKLLEKFDDEVKDAEITLDPWKQRVVKYYELYKLYQNKRHYEGLATIFVPEILRAVETVVGNLYAAITASDPFFEYQGRTKDEDASAAAQTQLTLYEMDENGFKHRLMDSLRQMATTGLTVRKVLWDFQQVARTRTNFKEANKIDPKTGKPEDFRQWKKELYIDTVKDHWTFEPVDLLSLLIPDITVPYNDMQKEPWIAEQFLVDKQWIRQRDKKGWVVDVDSESPRYYMEDDNKPTSSKMKLLKDSRLRSSGFSTTKNKTGKIEIIERWGLLAAHYVYDADGLEAQGLEPDDEIETVVIIANRKTFLKLEANPFWHNQKPYLFCPYVPQEFEFDGIGVGQIGEKLQEELNDTRNQTMDNKTLILMCMWLKSRGAGIKNADLRVRPLGVVQTNDMKGLEALRPPVLTGVGVNIEGTIKNDLRESVGAPSNMQGIAQGGVNTATESQEINSAARGRLGLTSELYGELVLKPMLLMAEYLNYQFYDHTKVIRIVGPTGIHFRKITPQALIGYKDVVLNINTDQGSPQAKRQQYMQFLTILQQMQPQQIEFHWKLLDRIYKESFGGRGLDELYEAPPEDAELLSVQDEVDLVLSGYPAMPQKREDARERSLALEAEYHKYKHALTPMVLTVFQSLIAGYEMMAMAQLKMAQAQMAMQMAAAGNTGNGTAQGAIPGQIPGATAFTQPVGQPPVNPAQLGGVAN